MTGAGLVKRLAAEIRAGLLGVKLPREYHGAIDNLRTVNVFEQYLPEDLFEVTDYYPLVLVELLKVVDGKDGSETEVGLSFGVFAKEADGWLDLFHLVNVTRRLILTKRLIASRYRLVDAEWESVATTEQPRPFLFANATLTYTFRQAEELCSKTT